MSKDKILKEERIEEITKKYSDDMINFFRKLVKTKSYTGEEEEIAKIIYDKMLELDYDKVWQDKYGDIIGKIGNGEKIIYFDSHMDTVDVNDAKDWEMDPFGAEIKDGEIYGRGSTDMKSGLVSSIYAGSLLKKLDYLDNKTLYITATVMEEDFDGVATDLLLNSMEKFPNYAVMCEPTSMNIGIGHKGRALIKITVEGKSAHGSRPELGINPTYILADILKKIEKLNNDFMKEEGNSTLAVTTITSETDSYNSIPREASLYIDYRVASNDNEKLISSRMDEVVNGIPARWEICDFPAITWTGEKIKLHSLHLPWELSKDHEFSKNALEACQKMGYDDAVMVKLGFSTNAVTTAGKYNIPTIVLGPGNIKYAHMKDERCSIKELIDACKVYVYMCSNIL